MPRLQIPNEPRQQGYARSVPKKRKAPSPPLGSDRASRSKTAAAATGTPIWKRRKHVNKSPNSHAKLILDWAQLPEKGPDRRQAVAKLCEEHGVSPSYPPKLIKRVANNQGLPLRRGHDAFHEKRINEEDEELIKEVLRECAYDLTFRQLEELTGIPKTTLGNHFNKAKGWYQCAKKTRPLLTEAHKDARLAWAKENLGNEWYDHVDLDEKWFYVYSGSGRLKMPAGEERPKTRLKSKRFVGKIMVLTAVTRPRGNFNGILGSWRVATPFIYKRAATFQGNSYEAGDSRSKDCEMDGKKFATMLRTNVFPAIRKKMSGAKLVTVQMDNAGGHGMATLHKKISNALPARKGGGPTIELVDQPAQSPDTNVCDLGLFRSVDSRIPKFRPFQLDRFARMVSKAHRQYPGDKVEQLYQTKIAVCKKMVEAKGDNSFDLHHRKRKKSA